MWVILVKHISKVLSWLYISSLWSCECDPPQKISSIRLPELTQYYRVCCHLNNIDHHIFVEFKITIQLAYPVLEYFFLLVVVLYR